MMEDVRRWEGRTVEGRFPLRQYLGGSERSAVFLTARADGHDAAIKLIPLDPATAEQQLARWKRATELSHPNLIRLFEMGRCRIDDAEFLFVVMESAEEDLSQILPQRALTPGEAQEMLGPVVDVLRYLHGKGWVHGHLKPSNVLALGDQVKVSSDGIGKVGERCSNPGGPNEYDPPEKAKGRNSAASDVWSLGMTLTEALTRQRPQLSDQGELRLPQGLTSPFLDIARNCLWRDPQQRWGISEIASQLIPGGAAAKEKPAPPPPKAAPVEKKEKSAPVAVEEPRSTNRWAWALLVAVVIAGGTYLMRRHSEQAPASSTAEPPATAATPKKETPAPADANAQPRAAVPEPKPPVEAKSPPAAGDEVVERVVPNIPRSARETIQGHVKVQVRVMVDAEGKVVGTKFDLRGPSEYFARQARQAAERWKFAAAPEAQRQWVLRFEFGRNGTQVFPSRVTRGH